MANEMKKAVIFDNGSGIFKAGLGEDDAPKVTFPTIVGKPSNPNMMVGMDQKDLYIGPEANQKRASLEILHPIKRGLIDNMEYMEKIWQYTYESELIVDAKEHPVFLTEPPKNDPKKREQTMQLFFETIGVNAFYLSIQAVLGLYSTGRKTGLVIDSGAGVTHTVPIYEGFALPFGTNMLPIAGDDLTAQLELMIAKEANTVIKPDDIATKDEIVRIKEKICRVAFDIDTARKESEEKDNAIKYSLPDGKVFDIRKSHFTVPEILFQPSLIYPTENDGIADKAFQSILKCEAHIHKNLFKNIVLIGGTCKLKGFSARLKKEISALAPSTMDVVPFEPLEKENAAFLGASLLSSIPAFQGIYVSKREWDEGRGIQIIHKKCF